MIAITRGTTTNITMDLQFDPEMLTELWLTISQRGREVLTKGIEEAEIDGYTVSFPLSQEDTLALNDYFFAQVQVRGKTDEGDAFASDIAEVRVEEVLKGGVI